VALRVFYVVVAVIALAGVGLLVLLVLRAAPLPVVDHVAPLTGEQVTEPIDHAVLATKVENTAPARPQAGLQNADIVYEVLTEGGITRFLALYHSDLPDHVGPIRSARLVDADLLPPYNPVFAISGGRAEVMEAVTDRMEVLTEGPGFFRSPGRPAPHNLYLRPAELLGMVDGDPPADPGWQFSEETPEGGTPWTEIEVSLSPRAVTGWEYDDEAGVYRRLQDGAPHETELEGEVAAANVVVLGVRVEPRNDLVLTHVVGEGPAVVLRDRERFEAVWRKDSPDDPIELLTTDGDDLPLKPGRTWVLMPEEQNLPPVGG
jgi:hypothetical protein